MRRRKASEKVEPFRSRIHEPEGHRLRDHIAAWAAAHVSSITGKWPALPPGVEDRAADV